MNLSQIHHVYFIGIGGIGMSALARYFRRIGKDVTGYDKTRTQLTDELEAEGIAIHFSDDIRLIPQDYTPDTTLVVVTPAVPKSHAGWNYFIERDYQVRKRAEVLGIITNETYCFAVAGTHGKTTTSAILGHILCSAGVDVTAFVGGIVENYGTNLIGEGKSVTVVEADEFDRSFLHLHPDMACVTSMDADHLDIYGSADSIEDSFREFAGKTDASHLFVAAGLPLEGNAVGVNVAADYRAHNIRIVNGQYLFDVDTPVGRLINLTFALPGHHNLSNAVMALAMAKQYGVSDSSIASALASFRGIRRRFSYQINEPGLVYIDDYAHHPTEIDAVCQAVREKYEGRKVIAVFQPHLFSRTKDFADGFARSLSAFDEIILLDIYPARELPMPGITSEWLLDKIGNPHKKLVSKDALIDMLVSSDADVFLTIGAGDIGEMVESIKKALHEKI